IPRLDGLGAVLPDLDGLAAVLGLGAAHLEGVVVLHDPVKVLLGVEVDFLGVLLVLEAQLVEVIGAAALGAARFEDALGLVGRQAVGRHLLGVVHPAGDDGPVRVALEEIDDDLLADAGVEDDAPVLAGPVLRDADPAGAVLVLLALAVPEELDLDPAVLVGVDLLALGPDHDGGLRALDERLGGGAGGAERHRVGDAGEGVAVVRAGAVAAVAAVGGRVLHGGEGVAPHLGVAVVVLQAELAAGGERAAAAGAGHHVVGGLLLLHAN